jgi:hypothetical protein
MIKPIRQRLQEIENLLYRYCRNYHDRTYSVINFVKELVNEDEELITFLDECLEQWSDPRSNSFFKDQQWPDVTKMTNDDMNQYILDNLEQYEIELPIFVKYAEKLDNYM